MISSSTDIQGLALNFVQADRASRDQLFAKRENEYNQTLKAYSAISEKLTAFQDVLTELKDSGEIESFGVTQSAEGYADISATSNAAAGVYEINIAQKASAHKIAMDFASETDPVPTSGNITVGVGADSFTIDMSTLGDGADLSTLRDAINDDPNNPGVSASIVRTNGSVKLMLGSQETGATNTVSISTDGDPALADFDTAIANKQEISAAQDAKIYLGSNQDLELTSSSNTFDNVIDGIKIDVTKVHADATETLTFEIGQDPEATKEKLQGVVDSYNAIVSELSKQKDGALSTNATLRTIEGQLRRDLSGANLMEMGIEIDRYGKMKINESDFEDALEANPTGLSDIFSGATGLIETLDNRIDTFVKGNDSVIKSSKSMVQSRLDSLQDQMTRFDKRMESVYNRYVSQFAEMQSVIAQMEQTSGMF